MLQRDEESLHSTLSTGKSSWGHKINWLFNTDDMPMLDRQVGNVTKSQI